MLDGWGWMSTVVYGFLGPSTPRPCLWGVWLDDQGSAGCGQVVPGCENDRSVSLLISRESIVAKGFSNLGFSCCSTIEYEQGTVLNYCSCARNVHLFHLGSGQASGCDHLTYSSSMSTRQHLSYQPEKNMQFQQVICNWLLVVCS